MAFSRRLSGKVLLGILYVAVFLVASQRLAEWSRHNSSLRVPSLRHPFPSNQANSSSPGSVAGRVSSDGSCASFPDTSNILAVVKTGASESYARIPTQIFTVLGCLQDFLIFSDMEQSLAGYHVRDSLDTVLDEAKDGNPEFDIYRRQKSCVVDQQSCSKFVSSGKGRSNEGWELDKYKNIHIVEKVYQLRPDYDWYLFIDADTYVLWHNLVEWLKMLEDPTNKKHYIGSEALYRDFPFAHGGSGYLLSQATIQDFAGNHSGIASQYDTKAKGVCCGDYLLSLALNETIGVGVSDAVSFI